MKPVHQVVRDLEFAFRQQHLTPSFLEAYAQRNGEAVLGLHAVAARHGLDVHPDPGHDAQGVPGLVHVEKRWEAHVDVAAVQRDQDATSAALLRAVHEAHDDDDRPACLRRPGRHALYPIKHA